MATEFRTGLRTPPNATALHGAPNRATLHASIIDEHTLQRLLSEYLSSLHVDGIVDQFVAALECRAKGHGTESIKASRALANLKGNKK